jgi:hypothetical protein
MDICVRAVVLNKYGKAHNPPEQTEVDPVAKFPFGETSEELTSV